FYYNSIMRRYLRAPQSAAALGPCIAGGAYLPALSDVILMDEATSFMGLGGPNLGKGAAGQTGDGETVGGAHPHPALRCPAHYRPPDDEACIARIRELVEELPYTAPARVTAEPEPPATDPADAYLILPEDHRQPYDVRALLACLLDGGRLDEFQADYAPEMICGTARIDGITVGVIANARGMLRDPHGGPPKFGGIVYPDSAEKVAYFIETVNRHGNPLLFIQDVSGFM